MRAVVIEGLAAARVDLLHQRAAKVLLTEAIPEQSAVHLLATEPVGEDWAAEVLAYAGQRALSRAAPESAAVFYERAWPSRRHGANCDSRCCSDEPVRC